MTDKLREHQIVLEKTFSKNQQIPRIREVILSEDVDFAGHFEQHGIPFDFGLDLMVQMILHKRANLNTLIGVLYHHFNNAQQTADMLVKCIDAYLVEYDPVARIFIVVADINADVQAEIDMFQYPLPMVVEPKPITHNKETGYLTGKGSVILRDNHHEDDVCLDHLNRMNRVKLCINQDVAKTIQNKWRNLDRMKPGETRKKFEDRVRAFEKYDRVAKEVMTFLTQEGPHFYLTHAYDKRGRTYPRGYHVNYAGNSWNKSVIELTDKELVK